MDREFKHMLSVYRTMNAFEKNIIGIYGDKAHQWLRQLPDVVTTLARQWQLSNLLVVDNLSYNFVMSGKQKEKDIILKFGLDSDSFTQELMALDVFSGHGCVNLLEVSLDHHAMLMEMANPGHSLKTLFPHQERESIQIASQLIQKLHDAKAGDYTPFKNLEDLIKILYMKWDIPAYHMKKACELSKKLLETTTTSVLLHGDFHHDNILAHEKGWVAIDPKGFVGDPHYEVSVFLYNPISELYDHPDCEAIIAQRVKLFANYLNYDEQRVKEWAFVQSILSTCWALEDNLKAKKFLYFNDLFSRLLSC